MRHYHSVTVFIWHYHSDLKYMTAFDKFYSFPLEYVSIVPTFTELEEPNIAAVWKEEDIAVVSHGSRLEPFASDRREPNIIPPASKPRGSTFKMEVREQLASLS